ncbi:MAG: class I SAM-dependent methyltransferase [Ferruginibacter sp.]
MQPDKEIWDNQFKNNKWEYLNSFEQLGRYAILVEYMDHFKNSGKFLDVGCGEGLLFKKYKNHNYTRYVGIDISPTAIQRINQEEHRNAHFLQADAESYISDETFSVIIFNESIYYFHDPIKTLGHYSSLLEKGGIFLISTSTSGNRGIAVLNMIKAKYHLSDEVKISHLKKHWYCSVFINK